MLPMMTASNKEHRLGGSLHIRPCHKCCALINFILTEILRARHRHYPHFTEGDVEARREVSILPKVPGQIGGGTTLKSSSAFPSRTMARGAHYTLPIFPVSPCWVLGDSQHFSVS